MTAGKGPVDRRVDGLAVYDAPGPPGAPRVVLVHGSMDRAATFAKTVRLLRDLDVVRYDRRGYGRSRSAGVASSVQAHADDLLAVVGARPAVVVGHSLGGVIAVCAAVARPDLVPSVAAFEAPMSWLSSWPTRSAGGKALAATDGAAAERFMRGIVGDAGWERLPERTRAARRAESPTLVAELASLRQAPPYEPARVAVPVLAGYGSESKPYHQDAARRLAEEAPLGELVVIEGSGHAAPLSHAPQFAEYVRRAVERALTSAYPSGARHGGANTIPTMSNPVNLSSGLPETVIQPESDAALAELTSAMAQPVEGDVRRAAVSGVVARHPQFLDAWARLGELGRDPVERYADFRVGYHRGLDRLRQSGWRGSGYVRWEHPTNRGFLRALDGLRSAAAEIGEIDEEERCDQFLHQLDPNWPPSDR